MISDYKNGKIYKITSPHTDKIYIGSTIQPLEIRLSKHRHDYKRYCDGRYNYVSSLELIDCGDCKIELIKNYPCNSKKELEQEEYRIQNENENCVNISGKKKNK